MQQHPYIIYHVLISAKFYKSTSTTGTKALDCVGGSFTFSKNRPTANNGYTPYL